MNGSGSSSDLRESAQSASRSHGLGGLPAPNASTLAGLWAELTWPKLLTSVRLSLRPARLGLALIYVLGVMLILSVASNFPDKNKDYVLGDFFDRIAVTCRQLYIHVLALDPYAATDALYKLCIAGPSEFLVKLRWTIVIALPLLFGWTGIFAGAICRTAACDAAHGTRSTWQEGLGFALFRWSSLWGALMTPLIVAWLIAFLMAVAGWAMINVSVLNVLAGLGWVFFVFGGFIAAVLFIAYVLGHPMLPAAVACEGADAVDAIQHAVAFVLAKPIRLVLYLAILIIQGIVVLSIAAMVRDFASSITNNAATLWVDADLGKSLLGSVRRGYELSSTDKAARWLIQLWSAIPNLIYMSIAVSLYWCSATMLFLAMRRVVDGQDVHELWMPDLVPGTHARKRSEPVKVVASDQPSVSSPQSQTPPDVAGGPSSQAVVDDGPADET